MKRCDNCGNQARDAAVYCEVCGRDAFTPIVEDAPAAEAPAAPADATPTPAVQQAETETETPVIAEAPAATESPAAPEAPADPSPAPSSEASPRPRLNLRRALAPDEAGEEREITAEDIAEVKTDDWFTIGLVGFPTAGKTWFLNRVKWCFSMGMAAYTVSPPKVPQLDEVRGSTVITLHRFALPSHVGDKRANRGLSSFVVLDIPGEAMARAVDRLASRYDIALGDDIVLEAFNVCDALIIMMPVDELLFSHELADREKMAWLRANGSGVLLEVDGERQALAAELEKLTKKGRPGRPLSKADAARRDALLAEIEDKLTEWREWMTAQSAINVDKFCDNLGKFANVIHLLQSSNALDIAQVRISEIIRGVAKQTEATATPVLFVMSKMDALESLPADQAARLEAIGIDQDVLSRIGDRPARSVRELAPGVAKNLTQHFKWLKFECVTAFAGHSQGDLRIDYELPHYGVNAIIEWINRIEAFSSGASATVRGVEWARRVGPG